MSKFFNLIHSTRGFLVFNLRHFTSYRCGTHTVPSDLSDCNIQNNLVYLVKPPGNIKTILPFCSLKICKKCINGGFFYKSTELSCDTTAGEKTSIISPQCIQIIVNQRPSPSSRLPRPPRMLPSSFLAPVP